MTTSKHRVTTKISDIYFENGNLKLGGDISYAFMDFFSSLLAEEYSLCQACQKILLYSVLSIPDDSMNKLQVGISVGNIDEVIERGGELVTTKTNRQIP